MEPVAQFIILMAKVLEKESNQLLFTQSGYPSVDLGRQLIKPFAIPGNMLHIARFFFQRLVTRFIR